MNPRRPCDKRCMHYIPARCYTDCKQRQHVFLRHCEAGQTHLYDRTLCPIRQDKPE